MGIFVYTIKYGLNYEHDYFVVKVLFYRSLGYFILIATTSLRLRRRRGVDVMTYNMIF